MNFWSIVSIKIKSKNKNKNKINKMDLNGKGGASTKWKWTEKRLTRQWASKARGGKKECARLMIHFHLNHILKSVTFKWNKNHVNQVSIGHTSLKSQKTKNKTQPIKQWHAIICNLWWNLCTIQNPNSMHINHQLPCHITSSTIHEIKWNKKQKWRSHRVEHNHAKKISKHNCFQKFQQLQTSNIQANKQQHHLKPIIWNVCNMSIAFLDLEWRRWREDKLT